MQTIAISGATGFAGRALVERLAGENHRYHLKCLIRRKKDREPSKAAGIEWVPGDVTSRNDLEALVAGADTVVHLAGLTRALNADEFHTTNTRSTAMLVSAARRAGVRTFLLVSSLAASRPDVSPYAWSKAIGETAAQVLAGDMKLIILRPPAVLGPADSATRDVMQLLKRGWLPCPGGAHGTVFSWIDVEDLAQFTTQMIESPPDGQRLDVSPYSGRSASWADIAAAGEEASGRKVTCIGLPAPLVRGAGLCATLVSKVTRKPLILSKGKANELLQDEWLSDTPVDVPSPLHETLSRCFLQMGENRPT